MYRYIGAWHGPVELEDFNKVNDYMVSSVPVILDMPMESYARYIKTDNFSMFPASEAAYVGIRQPLGWVNLGVVDGLMEQATLLEGEFPQPVTSDASVIPVLVSQQLAEEIGVQVGEEYVIFQRAQSSGTTTTEARPVQFTINVTGVWTATDPTHPYWFYNPRSLSNSMLVPESTFTSRVAPFMEKEIYAAIWYLVFNGDAIRTDDVPMLLGRINYANTRVGTLLPNTVLDISPTEALQNYRWTTFVMTIVLYVFSIPILGLVLYFIGLISGLVVERQRGEIAILKSRGAGDMQVIGIYALEGLMIGIVGLVLGVLLGKQLALVMGNTISFLAFGDRVPLPVIITPRSLRLGLLGVSIAMLASLWPAMQAARLTIVTYKRERARAMERPVWQRFFVDFLLLIPAGYGYYMLRNRGTINVLGTGGAGSDPFQDPLLFLVPSITIFAVSLLLIRFFPTIMEILSWATSQVVKSVAVVLAMRQLARVSKQYTGSLLLLVLTLSLATFTASMARTLDQSLYDGMYYRYGADYYLAETGESAAEGEEGGAASASGTTAEEIGGWMFVPVSEHLRVDGIHAATRVGSYPATANIGRSTAQGRFFGVDRAEFPNVAFFRRDFAYSQLGALMNRLALDSSALLVSPNFMAEYSLGVGDKVDLTISMWGERRAIPFIVADLITYFPTFYPDDSDNQFVFVGNLEYVFEMMGGVYPYDVWIRTDPDIDIQKMQSDLLNLDIRVISVRGSREAIEVEQGRPERTGVFGILSVGFVAAALLTLLGFLLHALISFRRRYIEFGVLRAIGLSVGQMIAFLLIATGITAGTVLGVWVSNLFIPFLQVGTAKFQNIPPFVVLIAWDDIIKIYAVFGVMLLAAVAGMIWFLLHLKIFEAVKLGEAV
jgi:putative ABC transport system permease protein